MMSTVNSLVTVDPLELDAKDLFSHLPANRVGEADRRYMQELFEDGDDLILCVSVGAFQNPD